MNLLVVDDDSIIRMLMRTILTSEGYGVVTASDGEEALMKLSESKFDLIVTDIYMPRLDGIRLRNIVRETKGTERTPILFISGYSDNLTMEAPRDRKLEGFFRKGRPLTELLAWIRYLTTPADKRPPSPPGPDYSVASSSLADRAQRRGSRTSFM